MFTHMNMKRKIGECEIVAKMDQDYFLWNFSLLGIQDLGPYLISEIRITRKLYILGGNLLL